MRSRYFFLIILLAGPLAAWAQSTDFRFYESDQPIHMMSLRHVFEVVNDLDPNGVVLHSDDMRILQIKVDPSISEADLRNAIVSTGIPLLDGHPVMPSNEPVYTTPDGRPLYVVSGDAAADRARYEEAVNEWNLSHPTDQLALPALVGEDQ